MTSSPYPLAWPIGRPRTAASHRKRASFGKALAGERWKQPLTVATAMDRLQGEVDRLGGNYAVISTNIPGRLDGKPRSGQPEPADPGVCLYFTLGGKPVCMPCDRYTRVADNIAAIAAHIEATRAIERHGVGTAAEALMAFTALPAPAAKRPWREVLGFGPTQHPDPQEVRMAFVARAKVVHGDDVKMAELNLAREAAIEEMIHP